MSMQAISPAYQHRAEPNGQLVPTLKKEEQSASKGEIAGLSTQLKAMQDSLELLAASR
jgi:hypothetical protein